MAAIFCCVPATWAAQRENSFWADCQALFQGLIVGEEFDVCPAGADAS
jgi:hypothetical protein